MNKFEDYQGIPIFEIPIYAYSKDDYRKRWKKKETRDREALIKKGYSADWAEKTVQREAEYPSIWQYNRMVGMFLLTVKADNCLYCHLYCNPKPPRSIIQRTHLPFINQWLLNECIFLNNINNDVDLVRAIKSKIEHLKFQHGIKSYYFDCSALENSISLEKIHAVIARDNEKNEGKKE